MNLSHWKLALRAMFVLLLATLVAAANGLAVPSDALAAPGDALSAITVPTDPCFGVGVAYDGTDVLYTCQGQNAIFKTDLLGNDLGSVATTDAGGTPIDLDAIAWDTNETVLWGGETNVQGTGDCGIWSVDMNTGLTTLRFTIPSDPHEFAGGSNCALSFFDGITVDTVTNTLYISQDVHINIHHFNKDGTLAANDNIPFEALTVGLCPWSQGFPPRTGCVNSGLAIGIDGNLFAGTASDGKIMQLNPATPAFIGQFATVSGRDEDLECGPLVTKEDASVVETILSRDLSRRIDVLEAPEGTCISPTVEEDDRFMTGGGNVVVGGKGKNAERYTWGFEIRCDGSQGNFQFNDHLAKSKFHLESITSVTCSDDPGLEPAPPGASFDTLVLVGEGRWNGVSGTAVEVKLTDDGEPGGDDTITIDIGGAPAGSLTGGNHQAHE